MQGRLSKKPEIFEALVPDYPVGCRRITPGPGVSQVSVHLVLAVTDYAIYTQFLEALVEDNVNFVPTKIARVYDHTIETEDGQQREVDIIICATGFNGYVRSFAFPEV